MLTTVLLAFPSAGKLIATAITCSAVRLAAATLSATCSLTSTVNCFGSGGDGEEGDGSKGRGGGGRNVGLDSGGGEGEGGHGGGDTVTENMVFSIQSMYRETRVYTPGNGCCELSTAAQP